LAIVSLKAAPAIEPEHPSAQLVIDVLWAFARPADGIEHIAARIAADRIDTGIYVRTESRTNADQVALRLVERAARGRSILDGWNIES
jgi:hypothetical protein